MSFDFHTKRHRKMPGLNATATADISFILLAFFLMVTSMDQEKGLMRQLQQKDDKNIEKITEIDARNVLAITLKDDGKSYLNDEEQPVTDLRKRIATFILGCPQPQKHIVTLEISKEADYSHYFELQNKILLAYKDVRETYAQKKYHAEYSNLNDDQKAEVRRKYPQRIAEKE